MNPYPLKLKPIFKERIWGGQRLRELFDKDLPPNQPIGESWELADLPNDKSEIVNGPLAGQTLDKAVRRFGPALAADRNGSFPLLIKLLDARQVLSVQVHPDAQTCRRMGKGQPKTECWYIIEAPPDGIIYKGLKPGTTRACFAQAVANGTCSDYLQAVPVKAGECHFLPAGVCHAIGAGLVIAEIQQPSDTTYRVFDWNRLDPATGKPRPLHIEEALESIHFDLSAVPLPVTTVGRLVDAPEFKLDKGHQMPGGEVLLNSPVPKAILFLSGGGTIYGRTFEDIPVRKGDTVLVPAQVEGFIRFEDQTEYLTAWV
ncbi:MAG TPA: class I mannose-6-phosphate isomerase [Anaerohalosphaeraceae bacterium]|nr:class I mannose-6-phosphate isomerase [Anaerohalosphaeraceae bacterium]HQG06364.1 class I mannose-6-phosphate isomerase [Anaerohalosphaeraceae bacterium]HQI07773.1 class I mannose-6-phosphate isomerase [Anaerohalosphaeraceae bacterium]HQJ68127.1 class I mannose-6-phosphate isomerase [Anaerohalosphaeraceae bacterium]